MRTKQRRLTADRPREPVAQILHAICFVLRIQDFRNVPPPGASNLTMHNIISTILLSWALMASIASAAATTQPTPSAAERAKVLKDQIKSFRLSLEYHGTQDKPYYGLWLSVPPLSVRRSNPFHPHVRISEAEASKIIDHLAREGFLDQAVDSASGMKRPAPSPCYTMVVSSGDDVRRHELYSVLGWNRPLIRRLDGLRTVLEGESARQMDLLLGRLGGHRGEWEREAASPVERAAWQINLKKKDDKVAIAIEGEKTIFTITSPSGIGSATVEPKTRQWPATVVVRLHLRGLESFAASNGNVKVSAAWDGKLAREQLWVEDKEGPALDASNRLWLSMRAFDAAGEPAVAVPIQDGWFEVTVPKAMLDEGASLRLDWIDFYRN